MIVDFRELDNDKELEFDLCIIGAGAAGITILREFIGSNIKVCCVESGGLYLEEDTQSLYDAENVGLSYLLSASRLRFFGGTTNHWAGWCAPLNETDFTERPWVSHSGWPITKKTLDPFYERAQPVLELGPYIYDERLLEGLDGSPINWLPEKLITRFWQYSSPPTRFGIAYKKEIEKAPNITVLLNANVTNLLTNNTASTIKTIQIQTLEGKKGRIKANSFVLACGGIENARILLYSNNLVPQGIGNQHDLVGRFFMEHPHISCGTLVTKDSPKILRVFTQYSETRVSSPNLLFEGNPVVISPGFSISDQLQEQGGFLNCAATLSTPEALENKRDSEHGITAVKELLNDYRYKRMPDDLWIKIWRIMKDLDEVALKSYHRMLDMKVAVPSILELRVISEQAPNPDSRVTLSAEKDALGLNIARLDWRLTELDKRTITALAKTIGTEFGRLNLARIRLDDWLLTSDNNWPPKLTGGMHHMGTTRMSDDPKKGVVNKDCRVHGVDNLYIAGSSVFPTGGYANPTLTIVALALRLADHLKDRLS